VSREVPDDLWPADPGLARLLDALAAEPTSAELAGEQDAVTMFRASREHPPRPAVSPQAVLPPAAVPPAHAQVPPAPIPPAGEFPPPEFTPAAEVPPDQFPVSSPGQFPPTLALPTEPLPTHLPPIEPTPGQIPADQAPEGWAAPGPRRAGPARPPRTSQPGWSAAKRLRLGLAAAVVVALAGTIAAAYAAALPPPVQHIAYRLLGFAGVPDASPSALAPGSTGTARPVRSSPRSGTSGQPTRRPSQQPSATPSTGGHSRTHRPSPTPSTSATTTPPESLALSASQGQIAAGGTAVLTGRVTRAGHPVAGARVSLLERPAGLSAWRLAASATTSAGGRVVVDVSNLATNADFRLAGPAGATSTAVSVTVVPGVRLRAALPPRLRRDAFVVISPYAQSGDEVLLQFLYGGSWVTVREHLLGPGHRAAFALRVRRAEGRTFRVVLLATSQHASAVSNYVIAPS